MKHFFVLSALLLMAVAGFSQGNSPGHAQNQGVQAPVNPVVNAAIPSLAEATGQTVPEVRLKHSQGRVVLFEPPQNVPAGCSGLSCPTQLCDMDFCACVCVGRRD